MTLSVFFMVNDILTNPPHLLLRTKTRRVLAGIESLKLVAVRTVLRGVSVGLVKKAFREISGGFQGH